MNEKKSTILIIDDDKLLREGIKINLQNENFNVITASNGHSGIDLFTNNNPDISIIDIMLPDISGFEILKEIRKINPNCVAIFLTARNDIYDKISGFTLGADDYITKPFDIRELILRIKARLKQNEVTKITEDTIFSNIRISPSEYRVYKNELDLQFTKTEYELLNYLILNKNIVLTREQIFERIWGNNADYSSRTVDMHISKIRKKIENNEKESQFIRTVFGIGYEFRV